MKKVLLTSVFLLFAFGVALAEYAGVVEGFTAHPDSDAISLDWRSNVESGVRYYAVERSDVKTSDFSQIGTVQATGNYSSYHFKDGHLSFANPSTQSGPTTAQSDLYKYRVRIQYDNEISYSNTAFVTRPSSGVRRTWGMIKEMFH